MATAVGLTKETWAQTQINGRIVDRSGPLQGATLRIQNTNIATASANDGTFTLNVHIQGRQALTVGYMGYRDTTVFINMVANTTTNLGEIVLQDFNPQQLEGLWFQVFIVRRSSGPYR